MSKYEKITCSVNRNSVSRVCCTRWKNITTKCLMFRGTVRAKNTNDPFSKYGMERPPIIRTIIDLKQLRRLPLWALLGFLDNDCLVFCQHHNSIELRGQKAFNN